MRLMLWFAHWQSMAKTELSRRALYTAQNQSYSLFGALAIEKFTADLQSLAKTTTFCGSSVSVYRDFQRHSSCIQVQ